MHFAVNVLAYDDCKDRLVSADVHGKTLPEVLDSVSWLLGLEWSERGGTYYVGGNSEVIQVFPSLGVDSKVENVFKNVKIVNDKIIAQGTERELKRVSDSLTAVLDRSVVRCRLKIIELVYDNSFEVGFDWEKSFDYGVSWENMIKNVHPVTHMALSAKASIQLDQVVISSRSLLDTDISILSGSQVKLEIGDETDRPVYSQSQYGDRLLSGYNTRKTGLLIALKAYNSGSVWVFDSSIENSRSITDLKKNISKVSSQLKTEIGKRYLVGNVVSDASEYQISQGIPILCRLPWVGFLFGVDKKIQVQRHFYVMIQVLSEDTIPAPPPIRPATYRLKSLGAEILEEFK